MGAHSQALSMTTNDPLVSALQEGSPDIVAADLLQLVDLHIVAANILRLYVHVSDHQAGHPSFSCFCAAGRIHRRCCVRPLSSASLNPLA